MEFPMHMAPDFYKTCTAYKTYKTYKTYGSYLFLQPAHTPLHTS